MLAQVHGCTDPGNHVKENQDTFLAISYKTHTALAVFDGHGKTHGKLAAETAKTFFEQKLQQDRTYDDLIEDGENTMRCLFDDCHAAIGQALRAYYERQRLQVVEREGGYLIVKQGMLQKSLLVQGGTTASIVVILNGGATMLCANVGDSSALLCVPSPFDASWSSLQASNVLHLLRRPDAPPVALPAELPESSHVLQLSGDHSPECMTEFERTAMARSVPTKNGAIPELLFVYDGLVESSNQRVSVRDKHAALEKTPVYTHRSGKLVKVGEGCYFKNVRQEWASLCCTPSRAKFHESLAFTRSLGDYYIHSYGLTHEPDVIQVDVKQLMAQEGWNQVIVVVGSDGVWDAWEYAQFSSVLWKAMDDHKGVLKQVADDVMRQNKAVSAQVFGTAVDNMTLVVCSLTVA
ncbi:hypothetical protein H310_10435 [Aphanomyces invadans]|uniref:PPM-type phosphatase domain-containing protein n=1 Tax=Aphanomyces invadans TaxID=157072 RepID=A0A024TQ37_9STRA|nr:hypothetical protein H310_10435 [Aphanomyces invadans]ETV96255.1 hypothetical protein H310_10435 [Aphanomyces invadans]|eukprot:XP_008875047.1 hypothetical protein H310_10435 [Aphanomyces invadans]